MEATTKRRPIRGLLYGLLLGLGATLFVVGQGIAALGTWPPFLVLVGGVVVGVLWSTMGPAKAPKGPPPVDAELVDEPVPAASDASTEAAATAGDAGSDGGSDSADD